MGFQGVQGHAFSGDGLHQLKQVCDLHRDGGAAMMTDWRDHAWDEGGGWHPSGEGGIHQHIRIKLVEFNV